MDSAAHVANAARRLALGIVLVTSAGGAVFILVDRPRGDCAVVADIMSTYTAFQTDSSAALVAGGSERENLLAVADAEANAGAALRSQAVGIALPELHAAAVTFADGVAQTAQDQREDVEQPAELDPFTAALPEIDDAHLHAADTFFTAAHVLLAACPGVPHPVGLI